MGFRSAPGSSSSPERESLSKRGRKKRHAQQTSCDTGKAAALEPHAGMTNSRRFHRSRSLKASKSPSLLDSGSFYNSLEEASLPGEGSEGAAKGSTRTPQEEVAQQDPAWSRGKLSKRAASLRVRKAGDDEAAAMGEAAHSLGPGDGQQLIGGTHGQAGSRLKKCRKVNQALRQGWDAFVTNLYSLTLSRPTIPRAATPSASSRP